jgi:hypothetical protein
MIRPGHVISPGNPANLRPFKPGERRVGRKAGTPNRLPQMLEVMLEMAAEVVSGWSVPFGRLLRR